MAEANGDRKCLCPCVIGCFFVFSNNAFSHLPSKDESPNARALRRGLPPHVKAVAMRNAKMRYFVPSTANYFAGEKYEYVMVDNGCNSFLLPYRTALAARFTGDQYRWVVSSSKGTGALKSPTLIIMHHTNAEAVLGTMQLAGNEILPLKKLRFHLGSESARALVNHQKLSSYHKGKLREFLGRLGDSVVSPEREHALLGQYYLQQVISVQVANMFMMCDGVFPTAQDFETVRDLVEPMREQFPGFDELEDEDHDGDDEEEHEFDYIDEPDD